MRTVHEIINDLHQIVEDEVYHLDGPDVEIAINVMRELVNDLTDWHYYGDSI